MGLEDLIKNARKIPAEYREQAVQYAHDGVSESTPFTRVKNYVTGIARFEAMMAIAGGIAGYVGGDAIGGVIDGLEIGALGVAAVYAINWFDSQSQIWKKLPEYQKGMAETLGSIGIDFEIAENPLAYAAKATAVSTILVGMMGIPFAQNENSFGIGALFGLMFSAYTTARGNRVIDAVQNYTIIQRKQAAEGSSMPVSADYFK